MVVTRIPIYKDDFADGFQDLPVLSGNGTVAETGGALVVSATAGVDMDWYTWGRHGKLPYVDVQALSNYNKIYYEFTIRSWTTTNNTISALVVALCQNDTVFWFLYSQNGATFNIYRNWATGSLGSITTTLPRKFRFVWDRLTGTIDAQCLTTVSPPVWTSVVTGQAVSMIPVLLGFGIKNWSSFPACAVQYEDTEIYADSFQSLTSDPSTGVEDKLVFPITGGAAGTGPSPGGWQYNEPTFAGVEDQGTLLSASGPLDAMSGNRRGQFVPEPEGIEDAVFFPSASVTPDRVTGIPEGSLAPPNDSGIEDTHYVETSIPAYAKGIVDADGREFLGDTIVYDAQVYDTTGETWAAPTPGNGFYGAARNGKFYDNGYECGPALNGTSFGTLVGGYNRRTWMTDVEPDAITSGVTQMSMVLVANDTLKFNSNVPLTDWNWAKYVLSRYRWFMTGDFDVQVSYTNRSVSGGSDGGIPFLQMQIDNNNCIYVRRHHNNFYDSDVLINGGYSYYASAATTDTYGRLRIVRVGNGVSSYYWNNTTSAWVLLRSTITSAVLGLPCQFIVGCNGIGSLTITRCDVFGFTINSGTVVNTAGWAREVAGTNRGSRADFPEKAMISATRYAVDIIDYVNNKLWMRFVAAANNAMHNAGIACRRVMMKNGILLVPYNTGGDICVDFTTDDIRVHLASGETWTGSILRAYNGVYWGPTAVPGRDVGAVGIIACRNLAGGYSGDYNNWQTPSTTVYDASLYESGGYLYKAHATASGMGGHKWRRWYNDGSTPENWWSPGVGKSAETTAMLWCQIVVNGNLFYLDATTIYSANFATWDAKVGGALQTWMADYSKALPGIRTYGGPQYRAAVIGSNVFVPADEGVYRAAWPLGSFTLTYGWSGSAYPMLPGQALQQVISIRAVADDSGTPLLAVGVQYLHDRQLWNQVVLVDPATNTIYGLSAATKARLIYSMAV